MALDSYTRELMPDPEMPVSGIRCWH
ncbi:unnamed protein product [Oppiella nova]|uniref:Uncharacterized protein n=1 Tax=Oppiella nova TaxID=334625 RepID=A0A7R9MUS0_9ACAR|nr:unnamed protein product [Oppiella nova]CAG2183605.1 unnamed protein product [Oppiella nova]